MMDTIQVVTQQSTTYHLLLLHVGVFVYIDVYIQIHATSRGIRIYVADCYVLLDWVLIYICLLYINMKTIYMVT